MIPEIRKAYILNFSVWYRFCDPSSTPVNAHLKNNASSKEITPKTKTIIPIINNDFFISSFLLHEIRMVSPAVCYMIAYPLNSSSQTLVTLCRFFSRTDLIIIKFILFPETNR